MQETGLNYGANRNPFNYDKFEQIDRDVVTPWLTLTEITNQLNLFSDESQDEYLSMLEVAVRMAIEDYLGMPVLPVTYRVYYGVSSLYGSPVALDLPENSLNGLTINSVKFYSDTTPPVLTTISSDSYFYDPTGSKVICSELPSNINTQMTSPVVVEYTVNASDLATYPVIKQAGLLLFTHLYNNRSATGDTPQAKAFIQYGIDTLLRPYKPLVM